MATTTHPTPTTWGHAAEDVGVALSDNPLVFAGDTGDDRPSGTVTDTLTFVPRRRSAITVLDLDRRAYVISPGIAPDHEGIALIGELDLAGAPLFEGAVAAALRHRPARVVLDLRRLEFIDARGAGTIAAAATCVREWDGSLIARGALPPVERVLELCGLGDLMGAAGTPALPRPATRGSVSLRSTAPMVAA